jgi:hypothetical protein
MGGIWHLHIYVTILFLFSFFLAKRVENGSQAKTKVKGKKHNVVSIHLFFHLIFSN